MATIGCVCPPKADGTPRYVTDEVTLREKLDFRSALVARNTVAVLKQEDAEASVAEILAALTEVYLLFGIESWTLTDAKGKPLEVSKQAVRALMADHADAATVIGDEADGLYTEAVIAPLLARASTSSPPTSTSGSTSATTGSSPTPRKQPKRSSISTIPTAVTERMSASPGGGYS
jgi:hypothetical protein